jgi:hypothetical protein
MKKLLRILHILGKRWVQVCMVIAALVLWAGYGLLDFNNIIKAPTRDPAAFVAYEDSAGKVVRLSEQKTRPFLRVGQVESETSEHYGDAMANFPTVLDCLQTSEWERPQPDLTKIDWHKIQNGNEADVCLFRIADSYASPEDMKMWLMLDGFVGIECMPHQSGEYRKGWCQMRGGWAVKQKGPKYNNLLIEKILIMSPPPIGAYGATVSIDYNEKNQVMSTQFGYSSL